jgi:geranylgeranyl diphosphate synthase type II
LSRIDYVEFIENAKNDVDRALECVFKGSESDITARAARYSLMGGGKRIRPIIMMLIGEMLSVSRERLLPYACAVEMIHTYSLIHDDLPCMDNDTMRRGRPTCHVEFSEATALLAGDALLNGAYELIFEQCASEGRGNGRAGAYLAECAGIRGMIGGQSEDISSDAGETTADSLYSLHRKKTGALIKASVMIPFLLGEEETLPLNVGEALNSYAEHLGLSFQIKDDLLDVSSTSEKMGKTVGKDERSGKATFVTLFGYKEAERLFEKETSSTLAALDKLSKLGYNTDLIVALTKSINEREK